MIGPMRSGLRACVRRLRFHWGTALNGYANIRLLVCCMTWAGLDSIDDSSGRFGPGQRNGEFRRGQGNGEPDTKTLHTDMKRKPSSDAIEKLLRQTVSQ